MSRYNSHLMTAYLLLLNHVIIYYPLYSFILWNVSRSFQLEPLPVSVTATTFGENTNLSIVHTYISDSKFLCALAGEKCDSLSRLLLSREACSRIWGEELKGLVEDRGKRGQP